MSKRAGRKRPSANVRRSRSRIGSAKETASRGRESERVADAQAGDAIAKARAFGIDIGQLRASLERTPDERLRELDANMRFVREIQSVAGQHRKQTS